MAALAFQAAADESDDPEQEGAFLFGGFVAPVWEWVNVFTPAWQDRVLNGRPGKPVLPYLHMVDIRSASWRSEHGLTWWEAENRVDEAAQVIGGTGSIHPVTTQIDGGHFREVFRETQVVARSKQPGVYQFEPDYIGYLGFAYGAIEFVSDHYPEAEKVDFLVEHKNKVTHHMQDFHKSLAMAFRHKGKGHLVRLIGGLIPGGKDRAPLQAADAALWHLRRLELSQCDAFDRRRLGWMFNDRLRTTNQLTPEQISGVGERSKRNAVEDPRKKKPKGRPNGAVSASGGASVS